MTVDDLLSSGLGLVAAIKPQIVVTAPNGQKLYLDASPSPSDPSAQGATLWPNGFSVSLKTGGVPANDPNVTDSPTVFFAQQSPTILAAPGPLGVSWGFWVTGAVLLAALPYLPLLFRKK